MKHFAGCFNNGTIDKVCKESNWTEFSSCQIEMKSESIIIFKLALKVNFEIECSDNCVVINFKKRLKAPQKPKKPSIHIKHTWF